MDKEDMASGRAAHEQNQQAVSAVPVGIPEAEPTFRSLYSPTRGMIACVLLQAAFRGDRQPCHFFGAGDWETSLPDDTFAWFEMPASAWRQLGLMTKIERISSYAQAIEAGTAATTGAARKGESAVPEGDVS